MLQRYQANIPAVTVATVRVVGTFFPLTGPLQTVEVGVSVPVIGPVTFDVLLNGVTIFGDPGDRPTIAEDEKTAVVTGLDVDVVLGDVVEVVLEAWPTGGLVGPGFVQVGVDDGIESGGAQTSDAVIPMSVFVTAAYNGILGRDPSGPELSDAVDDLVGFCLANTFDVNAKDFLDDLFLGAEFLALDTDDTEFTTAVFRAYFNREPDAGGLSFWESELMFGMTRANMRLAFAAHIEFRNRLPLYCRTVQGVADAGSIGGVAPATYVSNAIAATLVDSIDIEFGAVGSTLVPVLTETGVEDAIYGSGGLIPVIQVDEKGRILDVVEVPVTGAATEDVVYTTPSIANEATDETEINLGPAFSLYRIQADVQCRVRLYTRAAWRVADSMRPIGTDPTGEHGVIADFFLEAGALMWDLSNPASGLNLDDPEDPLIFAAIENRSGGTDTVEVTFTIRRT